jgi:hypothetical protein
MGSQCTFPTVTCGIFEFGFSDAILQMWASFLAGRDGSLDGRFGCATRREAQMSQRISKPRSNPTFPKGRSYHVNVAEAGGEATVVMATGVGSAPSEARAGAR